MSKEKVVPYIKESYGYLLLLWNKGYQLHIRLFCMHLSAGIELSTIRLTVYNC